MIDDPGSLDARRRRGPRLVRRSRLHPGRDRARRPAVRAAASPASPRDGSQPIVAIVPCHRDDGTPVLSVPVDVDFRVRLRARLVPAPRRARRVGAASGSASSATAASRSTSISPTTSTNLTRACDHCHRRVCVTRRDERAPEGPLISDAVVAGRTAQVVFFAPTATLGRCPLRRCLLRPPLGRTRLAGLLRSSLPRATLGRTRLAGLLGCRLATLRRSLLRRCLLSDASPEPSSPPPSCVRRFAGAFLRRCLRRRFAGAFFAAAFLRRVRRFAPASVPSSSSRPDAWPAYGPSSSSPLSSVLCVSLPEARSPPFARDCSGCRYGWSPSLLVHGGLEGGSCRELHALRRRDLDRLTGARVATGARGAR